MSRVRIIPVLLLKDGGLYKTIKFSNPKYVGDPINTVKIFNEKEADELILLDFTASLNGKSIDFSKISEIAGEAFMPMAYGGGIKSFEDAKLVFDAGYEKIVLNSFLFKDLSLIRKVASVYGEQAVVGSFDVGKNLFGQYRVFSHSGTKNTNFKPDDWAKQLEDNGVGEIMVNSIERDGTWIGYDQHLAQLVSKNVGVPVIICGGAGEISDFQKAIDSGASAVAAGSMFVYQKKGMGVLINFPSKFRLTRN